MTTRLLLRLLDQSIRLLHALTTHKLLMPLIGLRVLLRELLLIEISAQRTTSSNAVPWNKHQVCESDLVAHEVRFAGLGQVQVDDSEYTADLVCVAVDG